MEYLIFHSKYKGTPILDLFYDSDIVLEDTEERILEGIVNSKVHLLEVMDIDRNPDRCRVFMQDVFNSGTYEVINQGFSQSSYSGVLVGTSLIEIGHEIFMTSGSYFFSNRIERINYWQIIHSKNLNATETFL